MTITYNNVKRHGYNATLEAISSISNIECTLHTCIQDELESHIDDINYECVYDVTYYHEAFDIVTDSDFAPDEPIDFSECDNSLSCVMKEAQASVYSASYEGKHEAIEEAKEAIEEVYNIMLDEGFEEFTIKIGTGSYYGWAAHDYETESGVCVWKNIEGECFAVEVELNNLTFHCIVNNDKRVK